MRFISAEKQRSYFYLTVHKNNIIDLINYEVYTATTRYKTTFSFTLLFSTATSKLKKMSSGIHSYHLSVPSRVNTPPTSLRQLGSEGWCFSVVQQIPGIAILTSLVRSQAQQSLWYVHAMSEVVSLQWQSNCQRTRKSFKHIFTPPTTSHEKGENTPTIYRQSKTKASDGHPN